MDAIDGKQARRTGSGSNLGDVVGLFQRSYFIKSIL
jgi:phosphatidylglycerophosphate synthase